MGRTVLVTGVSRYLGARFAARVAALPGVDRVVGVDVVVPSHDVGAADFVRADIRGPVIARVIDRAGADTVVHMGVIATPGSAGGRVSMKEINVIGSMQLLAACQKNRRVERLVVKSTAGVYGATSGDPALFTEDQSARVLPRAGWAKDSVEVESYVRSFSRRRPDVRVVLLRFAHFIGPGVDTALTQFFGLPAVPVVLGFDPRVQFVHETDGLRALELAAMCDDVSGVVNVAGPGVVTVAQAAALAGRPVVPVPPVLVRSMVRSMNPVLAADFSDDLVRFLTFGRVLDTGRMGSMLGLMPEFSSRDAFVDFVAGHAREPLIPEQVVRSAGRAVVAARAAARRWGGRVDG